MNPEAAAATPPKVRPPSAWRVWENPIFRRYCRSRLRARGLFSWMLITVILSAFFYLIVPMSSERSVAWRRGSVQNIEHEISQLETRAAAPGISRQEREHLREVARMNRNMLEQMRTMTGDTGTDNAHIHQRKALIPLLIIQMLILFLLGTGQVAGGMSNERDDGMVDYQRLTPMTPLAKVMGYLFGLPVREWVLFLSTLPFTILALWRGAVPFSTWVPVALIFLTSVLLYHCTGLVAGTVFKNRRWAFLLSMGLIFLLYTAVPQGARLGLPFLKYVTMWPAAMEASHIFPDRMMRDWRVFSGHVGGQGVEFFQWRFSDVAFTLLVQGCFIVTMLVMVWRKWKRAESHLLSKVWALIICAWAGILSMGTVLPGIADASVFPETSIRQIVRQGQFNPPTLPGAAVISTAYAVLMFVFLLLLVIMVTPSQDAQARGLRRAAKYGRTAAPWQADESSSFRLVAILCLIGAAGCTWFTRAVLGSDWFHADPGFKTFPVFLAIIAPPIIAFHALLESRGGKWPFLAVVLLGLVPLLTALIMAAASNREPVMAVFVAGASPFALPAFGLEQLLPLDEIQRDGTAFRLHIYTIAAAVAVQRLRRHWRDRKAGK
jgi:hypothetical protein